MSGVELFGSLYGKQIYKYDPQLSCSEKDLRNYLSQFKLLEGLQVIGRISAKIFNNKEKILHFNQVPIDDDLLLELAFRLVKCSDISKDLIPSEEHIAHAARMYHALYDKEITKKTTVPNELLMILSYRQFAFQEKPMHKVSRAYLIYKTIWKTKYPDFDILKDIKEITGFSLEVLYPLVFAFLGRMDGFFTLYSKEQLAKMPSYIVDEIDHQSYAKFVKWCAVDLDDLKRDSAKITDLIHRPVIQTRIKPVPEIPEVFMIPSYATFYEKLTAGLYFALSDKYNAGGKSNRFKQSYGFVFQEYVGVLLRKHLPTWTVHDEIQYAKGKDSVDWLVQKGNKLMLIEVKQSSIYLDAKLSGNLTDIKDDVLKTVSKAVSQLKNTEDIIKSGKYICLGKFADCKSIQKLVVLSDPLYNANAVIKDLLKNEHGDYQYQIINIGDFETFLAMQADTESLFDLMEYKSLNTDYINMDFKEFILAMYQEKEREFPFFVGGHFKTRHLWALQNRPPVLS